MSLTNEETIRVRRMNLTLIQDLSPGPRNRARHFMLVTSAPWVLEEAALFQRLAGYEVRHFGLNEFKETKITHARHVLYWNCALEKGSYI